jgi:hypothetical protein
MDQKTYQSLIALLSHVAYQEWKDWDQSGRPRKHVYAHVRRLEDWADEVAKDYAPQSNIK